MLLGISLTTHDSDGKNHKHFHGSPMYFGYAELPRILADVRAMQAATNLPTMRQTLGTLADILDKLLASGGPV